MNERHSASSCNAIDCTGMPDQEKLELTLYVHSVIVLFCRSCLKSQTFQQGISMLLITAINKTILNMFITTGD